MCECIIKNEKSITYGVNDNIWIELFLYRLDGLTQRACLVWGRMKTPTPYTLWRNTASIIKGLFFWGCFC